jgi:hypothetical protein
MDEVLKDLPGYKRRRGGAQGSNWKVDEVLKYLPGGMMMC